MKGNKMNKSEQKHVTKAIAGAEYFSASVSPQFAKDYLARALSIIIRSTMSAKTKREIIDIASYHSVNTNPEFIC